MTATADHGRSVGDQRALVDLRRLERAERLIQFNFIAPCLLFLAIFFFIPVVAFLAQSLFDPHFTTEHYEKAFTRPVYLLIFWRTLKISLLTTLVCLLAGYPVAFVIAQATGRLKTVILVLVLVPFWTNILVRMFAWLAVLGRNGIVNSNLVAAGVIEEPVPLLYNDFSVVLGMTHYMLPFMILPCYSVMAAIPPNLTDAAANLGAKPLQAFWRVYFPLSLPGIGAGSLLVFILSLGFFITPALMGGAKQTMLAQVIERQINQTLDWGFAAALSAILLVLTVVLYIAYERVLGVEKIYGGKD